MAGPGSLPGRITDVAVCRGRWKASCLLTWKAHFLTVFRLNPPVPHWESHPGASCSQPKTAHRWRPWPKCSVGSEQVTQLGCESWSPESQSSAFSTFPKPTGKDQAGMGANLSSPGFLLRRQWSVLIQLVAYTPSLPLSTEEFPGSSEDGLLNSCMIRAAGPRGL